MAVLIPDAQTPFAPVQQPRQQNDGAGVGAALQIAGGTAVNIVSQQKERQRSLQMQEARVSAVEQIGALRTEFERDTNVVGLSDRFTSATDDAMQAIAETLPEGQMRDAFLLDVRQAREPQRAAIARREFALEADIARANTNRATRAYVNQAADAPDDESQDAILSEAAAHITAMVDAGYYSEVEGDALITQIAEDTTLATAMRTAADDPAGFLENKDAGAYGAIDPVTLERMETSARADIARIDATAARAAEVEAEAQAKILTSDVDDAVSIIESGLPFDGLLELQARVSGTEEEARLNATIRAAGTEGNFAVLSPPQMDAVIAEAKADPTADPDDIARIERLEAMREQTAQSLANDPLTHVAERGITDVAPIDLTDFAAVSGRIAQAETIAVQYATGDGPISARYFTNPERDTLKAQIASGDAETQLTIATQLVSSFGDRAPSVLAEIGADDPLFQMAGSLVWSTNDPSAARIMLQGRTLAAEGNGAKVDGATRGSTRATIAGMFLPGSQDRAALLIQAAEAHYAAAGMLIDPEAEPAQKRDAFMRSLQAVAGQVTRGGVTYGGLQEVNGHTTLLPATINAVIAEDAMTTWGGDHWGAASVTGGQPYWGNRPLWELIGSRDIDPGDIYPQSIGGGQYLVGIDRGDGQRRYLTDDTAPDGLFRMNLDALVRVTRPEQ